MSPILQKFAEIFFCSSTAVHFDEDSRATKDWLQRLLHPQSFFWVQRPKKLLSPQGLFTIPMKYVALRIVNDSRAQRPVIPIRKHKHYSWEQWALLVTVEVLKCMLLSSICHSISCLSLQHQDSWGWISPAEFPPTPQHCCGNGCEILLLCWLCFMCLVQLLKTLP